MSFFDVSAFVLIFVLSLATSILAVPFLNRLSQRFGVVSHPGGRRREAQPMPKLGGLAIVAGFFVAVLAAQALPVTRSDPYEVIRLVGLLLGALVITIVGILDDLRELSYFQLFMGQIFAAGIAIFFQIFIEFFNNPLSGQQTDPWPYWVTIVLTMFWLGLMMNTVNFLDGLDGLAAGVAVLAGLLLFLNSVFFVVPAQVSVGLLPLALAGACLGFLLYNFHPAQTYMGGSALFLGYALGTLSIIGGAKMATILLVMGLPLTDLALQAFERMRRGQNPFQGDRGHIHFRLLDSGLLSHRQIVLLYYLFCASFGALTLILESQLYKLLAFAVMLACIAIGFALMKRIRPDQSSR